MNKEVSPPPKLSGISIKLLVAYREWNDNARNIPKLTRYSLGSKIDLLFTEIVESTSEALFSARELRGPLITKAITKNDTLKFMLYALFEMSGIEEKIFLSISLKLEEVGRMLYGWRNQSVNRNRPEAVSERKKS